MVLRGDALVESFIKGQAQGAAEFSGFSRTFREKGLGTASEGATGGSDHGVRGGELRGESECGDEVLRSWSGPGGLRTTGGVMPPLNSDVDALAEIVVLILVRI